ncbi:TetR/AcrR family transcriptional regulator [Galbitalea soli]|uniref:TetR/AcrR family transcriptional regulator n=1 Tax=Galbitalea soli TaxID=1268042 RepID=A0A7C9TMG8_9MICO|nr:TetR/AcrR family transcriptional regulator [Galbitalea soli]NEM89796.1 TetR/AcrR family transcriptional regulator [Galbitalea soli]NYJ30500.1 AcrR family transcriptional regulator [Galbitalea soli]
MPESLSVAARIMDAAADVIVGDGFDAVSLARVAQTAGVSESQILAEFGSLDEALVLMLNREFTSIYVSIVDNIERDPRGGLLSRIYYYTLTSVYERPLAKVLYTADRDAMNTIMRNANSFGYVPGVGIRSDFVEGMQRAGMVRRDIDAETVSHLLTIFSAGLALTAPHADLDQIVRGVTDVLARAVDTEARDTTAGKRVFFDWAMKLTQSR